MRWKQRVGICIIAGAAAVPCLASAQTAPAAQPTSSATNMKEDAGKRYDAGAAAQKKGDWQAACDEYEGAYLLYQHPQILVSLGVAELHVGRYVAAASHLRAFLDAAPADLPAVEREAYVRDLAEA